MAYDRLVMLDDIGRRFTARVLDWCSGGDILMFASGTNTAGSSYNSYAAADIAVQRASGTAAVGHATVVGVAGQTVASGTTAYVPVIMQGIVILPAGSNGVTGGQKIAFIGYENMVETPAFGAGSIAGTAIGRALTAAADQTNLAIVRLNV